MRNNCFQVQKIFIFIIITINKNLMLIQFYFCLIDLKISSMIFDLHSHILYFLKTKDILFFIRNYFWLGSIYIERFIKIKISDKTYK